MTIDLHAPTSWSEVAPEQLRDIVDLAGKEIGREEYLLVLFCRFTGINMVAGTAVMDGRKVVRTRFKTAEGQVFDLADWQLAAFCGTLAFILEEPMPIETNWPFKWDRYLMDTTFGDWFHADALMLGYNMFGDLERLKGAMKDLGDPHDDLQPDSADRVLLLKWYECFKDWLRQRYPLVFKQAEPGSESPTSPIEARQDIMLMLNEGKPQENEAIERSNMHDVLSALQHKIEEAKHIEELMSKYR